MKPEVRAAALRETWAINQQFLFQHLEGDGETAAEPRRGKLPKVEGGVAILPMCGMILQRESFFTRYGMGCSTQGLGAAFTRAINNQAIAAVILDIDSPGGTISGVPELADIIFRGAQLKPVVAIANSTADSAAYWLGSQVGSGRFVAPPRAYVGNIGVWTMHVDESAALEAEGLKVTLIATPEFKVEGNPWEPLGDEAKEFMFSQVTDTYEMFVKHVARGRGVPASRVKSDFGKGRELHAEEAAEIGLIDRVATLAQVLAELGVGTKAQLSESADKQLTEELCQAWEKGIEEPLRDRRKEKVLAEERDAHYRNLRRLSGN